MPSPGLDIQSWSTTPLTNGTADPSINFPEGQTRGSLNDSCRAVMASVAFQRNLTNGSITTGGSANAQTVTSGMTYTSVPTGLRILVKIGFANNAATTLNLDAIGAVTIKNMIGADLVQGNLRVGQYAELLYNGTNWILLTSVTTVPQIVVQKFTASGTYTPTAGMTYCIIELVGGGGGGGGASGGTITCGVGGGGGSGGYARKIASATQIGASQVVTIGTAGAAGGLNASGGTGGATSVGSLCAANGGVGGTNSDVPGSSTAYAGNGGAGTAGDILVTGDTGSAGFNSQSSSLAVTTWDGDGGHSFFGAGGRTVFGTGTGGAAAANTGGGGAGGSVGFGGGPGTVAGGAGGTGVVLITEFIL